MKMNAKQLIQNPHLMNTKLEAYFSEAKKWLPELLQLRSIVLDSLLTETFKWRNPCYTFQNGNVVIIGAFKEYCALLFFKGALLHDEYGILVQQTENVQSGRQIRFTTMHEIISQETILKAYINEAIEVEKIGLKIEFLQKDKLVFSKELLTFFSENIVFKEAFEALTPGRQRAYNLHFSSAKQSKTTIARIEQCMPRILNKKGLHDCTCGLSKRMPNCDGSHKFLKK
jgi:uncharacterized protein YdeI (YjbR/CyaY-like superfamily)